MASEGSGISVLPARYDDDDEQGNDVLKLYIYIYNIFIYYIIYVCVCV